MPTEVTQLLDRLSPNALIALAALALFQLARQIWAIVDLMRRDWVRFGRKWIWLLVIICGGLLGTVVYAAFGIQHGLGDGAIEPNEVKRDRTEAGLSNLYRDRNRE